MGSGEELIHERALWAERGEWCLCGAWLKERSKDEVGTLGMIRGRPVQLEEGEPGGSRRRCAWRGRQRTGSIGFLGQARGLLCMLMLRKFFQTLKR